MDNFVDERDYRLLDGDRYSFAILRMIVGRECMLLLTDHEKVILCKAVEVFPAWIWTPDGAAPEEAERVYALAAENGLLRAGQHIYMKYDLAEFWIKRVAADGLKVAISSNTNAYDCPEPVPPADAADGAPHKCTEEDADELSELLNLFHVETRMDQKDEAVCRKEAEGLIRAGRTYFWKDGQGRTAACCTYAPDGDLASISNVFTRPAFRRKHCAENLVYHVTALAKGEGFVPMLYADADYEASNGCYKKIGYVLRGKLCTVEVG